MWSVWHSQQILLFSCHTTWHAYSYTMMSLGSCLSAHILRAVLLISMASVVQILVCKRKKCSLRRTCIEWVMQELNCLDQGHIGWMKSWVGTREWTEGKSVCFNGDECESFSDVLLGCPYSNIRAAYCRRALEVVIHTLKLKLWVASFIFGNELWEEHFDSNCWQNIYLPPSSASYEKYVSGWWWLCRSFGEWKMAN